MYALQQAKKEALAALKKHIGKGFILNIDMLAEPPKPELGDLCFPCFTLAKGMGRNPAEIASELSAKIGPSAFIKRVHAVGPYVNFVFDKFAFAQAVLTDIGKGKARYGVSTMGKGKRILVEYASLNTHKEFHVGHVRNTTLGQSIVHVMKANGYGVIPTCYIGDVGAHVAKAIWGLKKFYADKKIAKKDRAKVLQDAYTQAHVFSEDHVEAKEEIAAVQRALEEEKEPWQSLWEETREWSLEDLRKSFKEFGIKPDVWYFESQVEKSGKDMVKKLLIEGIAKKSEGATIVDLTEEKLGIFLILKTDGSALYATKDLALAFVKEEEYHPDRQIFVVDNRQSLYLQQLFATLRRLGFTRELTHIGYEFVTLPDGAMSSRKGNIVRYEDLRDTLTEKIFASTRERHTDWNEKKLMATAQALAFAAMKFVMLRQDNDKKIVFDMEEAASVEGFTGPYLLYTIARLNSIERKAHVRATMDTTRLIHPYEQELVTLLAKYPDLVAQAGLQLRPSMVAQYAFELAQMYARYYEAVRILDDADQASSAARLALCGAIKQTLTNALSLLGITTVDEM